jgi:hypothetical protein
MVKAKAPVGYILVMEQVEDMDHQHNEQNE